MKQITNKTILKQGDKTYQPIEVDGVIYWIDESLTIKDVRPYYGRFHFEKNVAINTFPTYLTDLSECKLIIAQSQTNLEGVPIISLESYVKNLAIEKYGKKHEMLQGQLMFFKYGYKSNPNQYTQKDIEKAIKLGKLKQELESGVFVKKYSNKQILEQINSISIIEVDEQFKVINYE
jgi:site-specific recombinase XerD